MSCLVMACIKNTLSEIARIDRGAAKKAKVLARVEEGKTSSAFFFRLGIKQMADRWVSAEGFRWCSVFR